MQRLEVSCAVRLLYRSLGVKGLIKETPYIRLAVPRTANSLNENTSAPNLSISFFQDVVRHF